MTARGLVKETLYITSLPSQKSFQGLKFMMAWKSYSSSLLLLSVCISISGSTVKKDSTKKLFEEEEQYFCYQYARQAVGIDGRLYVKIQNFNSTLPPLCDSAQRMETKDDTHYIFELAAVVPVPNMTIIVKFNTSLNLSKTGDHTDDNAMTYQYTTFEPPKLRKLMYLSPKNECMIFVDDRNSTDAARCQLLQPAQYANDTIPTDCAQVYRDNCPGPLNLTVYQPWCQGLPEITVEQLKRMMTTPAPKAC